jgi:hypothetical protein
MFQDIKLSVDADIWAFLGYFFSKIGQNFHSIFWSHSLASFFQTSLKCNPSGEVLRVRGFWPKKLAGNKHSSLFCQSVSDEAKKVL